MTKGNENKGLIRVRDNQEIREIFSDEVVSVVGTGGGAITVTLGAHRMVGVHLRETPEIRDRAVYVNNRVALSAHAAKVLVAELVTFLNAIGQNGQDAPSGDKKKGR